MSNEDQDVCKLTLYLKKPEEIVEILTTRQEVLNTISTLSGLGARFVHINGVGYAVKRIVLYEEEDMNGKSVTQPKKDSLAKALASLKEMASAGPMTVGTSAVASNVTISPANIEYNSTDELIVK